MIEYCLRLVRQIDSRWLKKVDKMRAVAEAEGEAGVQAMPAAAAAAVAAAKPKTLPRRARAKAAVLAARVGSSPPSRTRSSTGS